MIEKWPLINQETIAKGLAGKEFRKAIFLDPKTKKNTEFTLYGQRDFSIILPVTVDNMVVTIRQYYQGCDQILQTLPGGDADFKKEEPEKVAKRELLEETGYRGEIFLTGGPFCLSARSSWSKYFVFLGLECEKVAEQKLDQKEDIGIELLPLSEWIYLAQTEIKDPTALVATFCALRYLGAGRWHSYM